MEMVIREARPEDAERVIAYVQRLSDEPGVDIGLSPGEFTLTIEEEEAVFVEYAAAENAIFLIAEVDGQLAGVLTCKGSKRLSFRHAVALGVAE